LCRAKKRKRKKESTRTQGAGSLLMSMCQRAANNPSGECTSAKPQQGWKNTKPQTQVKRNVCTTRAMSSPVWYFDNVFIESKWLGIHFFSPL
jgi:hypothetical protein